MAYKKVDWPRDRVLRSWYERGDSTTKIAARLGVKPNSVGYRLCKIGVEVRSISKAKVVKHRARMKRPHLLEPDKLRMFYTKRKKSTYEIAALVGCERSTVVRALHEAKIPIRHVVRQSEAHKRLVRALRSAGVDVQDWQVDFRPKGFHYFIDIALPEQMVAVEVDGYYHEFREEADQVRQTKLEKAGWFFIRFDAKDAFNDPHTCAEEVIEYAEISKSAQPSA